MMFWINGIKKMVTMSKKSTIICDRCGKEVPYNVGKGSIILRLYCLIGFVYGKVLKIDLTYAMIAQMSFASG